MFELLSAVVVVYGLGILAARFLGDSTTWPDAAKWPLRLFAKKPEA